MNTRIRAFATLFDRIDNKHNINVTLIIFDMRLIRPALKGNI